MMEQEYPILEFDEDRNALIRPEAILKPKDISEKCVLCFFAEAIAKILKISPHRIVEYFQAECMRLPIYEVEYKGEKIVLIQAGVGAPVAAAQIEELTAYGCKKFIACGGCGVLQKDITVGHLILPTAAVRDEGTSYHYLRPSREVEADPAVVRKIEESLLEREVPYIKAKTWTTDALYRETPEKIRQRKQEGCVTVDMEASAYFAVSQYAHVEFGQIFYAGDNLDGEVWDSRSFTTRSDIREFVLKLALDVCLEL